MDIPQSSVQITLQSKQGRVNWEVAG